jgi:hypothetical protein
VLQGTVHGEVAVAPSKTEPSQKNSTRVTPTLSLALAESVTVPLIVVPLDGAVNVMVGATVSTAAACVTKNELPAMVRVVERVLLDVFA